MQKPRCFGRPPGARGPRGFVCSGTFVGKADVTESRSRYDWLRAGAELDSFGGNFRQPIFDTEGDRTWPAGPVDRMVRFGMAY